MTPSGSALKVVPLPHAFVQVAVLGANLRLVDTHSHLAFLKNFFQRWIFNGGGDMAKGFAMKTAGVFLPLLKPSRRRAWRSWLWQWHTA